LVKISLDGLMEKTYRLTSAAESDLIEILDYTTQQWGIAQADKYAGEIEDCLSAIVKGRVHAKAFLIEDIKILILRCKSHYIFFSEREEWVDVLAILHTSRDLVMHLQDRLGDR
jgi:plasmid stabilization system protein ParE